jgi:hypothetical protein
MFDPVAVVVPQMYAAGGTCPARRTLDEQLLLQADPPVAVLVVAVVEVLDAPPAVEVLAPVELALVEPPPELALLEVALAEVALVEPAVVEEVVELEPVDDVVEADPLGGSQKM